MARILLTALLIVFVNVLVGCQQPNQGAGSLLPSRAKYPPESAQVAVVSGAAEADIVEQVAANRQAYRQGLESLVEYYNKTGNNMKLKWAQKELARLDRAAQYRYIIEAEVAGAALKAKASIAEADELYAEAIKTYKKAKKLVLIIDNDKMRVALDKFNEVIRKYPTSDKIDDAAFKAGQIYYYFKDYSIALLYYQRTYQWDAETVYPARYKAAYILDRHLHQRDEALKLYQQFIEKGAEHLQYKRLAEQRILEKKKKKSEPTETGGQ